MDPQNLVDGFPERFSPALMREGGWDAPDHFARYLFACHFAAGRTVADLCCGSGFGSNLLLAAGAKNVCGFDIHEPTLETARRDYPGVQFEIGSVDAPLDLSRFDVCVCMEGIEHVQDPDQLLANMRGAELAFISTPNAEIHEGGFSGNPHHVQEWTRASFDAMLRRHFTQVRMYCQWYHPSPFEQDWSAGAAAKAMVPVKAKARLRRLVARGRGGVDGAVAATSADPGTGAPEDRAVAWDHHVYPASYLRVVPPGLRFGGPHTWLAVCS